MPTCTFCDQVNPPGATRCTGCGAELPGAVERSGPGTVASSVGADNAILDLMARGQKIEAIKLYREQTGLGLAEAKAAVEAIERGQQPAPVPVRPNISDDEILAALQNGSKIGAIKLYRERTGVGLKDAKEAVEALAARHGVVAKGGCAGMLLFGITTLWCVIELFA